MTETAFWCEWAWLPDGPHAGVLIEVDGSGRVTRTTVDGPPDGVRRLPGLTLPGTANAHSHAFHRALRGRTSEGRGTFWTWRQLMYAVAQGLTPDSYRRLATAVFAEMALAGITCVGEFHYLHHGPEGVRYDDPNEMSAAVVQAAADAGVRLTLLDTCYLTGGFATPLEGVQLRFGDGDVDGWLDRVGRFADQTASKEDEGRVRLGAALHSVRAVPVNAFAAVRDWATAAKAPLHLHLSEQRAENDACLAAHGCTPAELLDLHGVLGAGTTAIHATHLAATDVQLLGDSRTGVCLCPSTEADLADGVGPVAALATAGSPLSVGSDGQTVIDLFSEVQAVEFAVRLTTETRGAFTQDHLLAMATAAGHRALGWHDVGWIGAGARADLVSLDLGSPRLAGVPPEAAILVARSSDVREVVVGGEHIVHDGVHQRVPDVAGELRTAIEEVLL